MQVGPFLPGAVGVRQDDPAEGFGLLAPSGRQGFGGHRMGLLVSWRSAVVAGPDGRASGTHDHDGMQRACPWKPAAARRNCRTRRAWILRERCADGWPGRIAVIPNRTVLDSEQTATLDAPLPAAAVAPRAAEPPGAVVVDRRRPWRPAAGMRIAIVGLFLLGALVSLYFARPILLPILIAVLLSLLLSPAVTVLERARLPRPVGAVLVVAALLTVVGGLGMNLYAPVQQWISAGPEQLAELRRKLQTLRKPVEALRGATERVSSITDADAPRGQAPREVVIERRSLAGLVSNTQAVLVSTMTVVILLYFLLASGDMFLRKLIRVIPNLADKIRAVEITRTIQAQIGRYFGAITTINVTLGVVTGVAMGWLGLPTPLLIGTLVCVFNFVPYLGPLTSLALISVISVLTFDLPSQIVLPPLVFAAIAAIEGQVLQPVLLGRHLSTTAVVMFLWVLFWGWMWGVGGVVVAVPLLVALKICAEHIPSWAPIAELLGRD